MTIVVDTSVILKWLVAEEGHEAALVLLGAGFTLTCPDFAFAEVASALRCKVRFGEIDMSQATESLVLIPKYFDQIVPSAELLTSSFSLSAKLDHSVYDCMFLGLAMQQVGSVLVTADKVFLKKCISAGYGSSIRHHLDHAASAQTKSEPHNG